MALEEGPAVFMKYKFHIYLHLEKDQMTGTLALPHVQERGKKEVVPFFGTPDIKACKIRALKGPEFLITEDRGALVRMPSVLSLLFPCEFDQCFQRMKISRQSGF